MKQTIDTELILIYAEEKRKRIYEIVAETQKRRGILRTDRAREKARIAAEKSREPTVEGVPMFWQRCRGPWDPWHLRRHRELRVEWLRKIGPR